MLQALTLIDLRIVLIYSYVFEFLRKVDPLNKNGILILAA